MIKVRQEQDRQCTCKRNIEARSRNRFCSGQAIIITHSECVSIALRIQHAKRIVIGVFFFFFLHVGTSPPYWISPSQLCFSSLFPVFKVLFINICLYTVPTYGLSSPVSPTGRNKEHWKNIKETSGSLYCDRNGQRDRVLEIMMMKIVMITCGKMKGFLKLNRKP